jgi:hypothetical protein
MDAMRTTAIAKCRALGYACAAGLSEPRERNEIAVTSHATSRRDAANIKLSTSCILFNIQISIETIGCLRDYVQYSHLSSILDHARRRSVGQRFNSAHRLHSFLTTIQSFSETTFALQKAGRY